MEHILLFLAATAMTASLQGCSGGGFLADFQDQDGTGTFTIQNTSGSWECKSPGEGCKEGTFQMTGDWGSKDLNIPTQPISASGCWKMPPGPDGWKQLQFAGSSSGFGTDSTFSFDPSGMSYQVCFASQQDQFHGTITTSGQTEPSGSGTMTAKFTACKGYKQCDASQQCSSGSSLLSLSQAPDAQNADNECAEHDMTYSWLIEPDPNSPLKYTLKDVECTFDDVKCSDLLSGLLSSGDSSQDPSKEQAQKAGIAALTTAVAGKQGGTEMVKDAASSGS